MWRARPNGLGQSGYPPQRNKRALGKKRGSNQQVELKDEGGAAGYVGGGAVSPNKAELNEFFKPITKFGETVLKSESLLS